MEQFLYLAQKHLDFVQRFAADRGNVYNTIIRDVTKTLIEKPAEHKSFEPAMLNEVGSQEDQARRESRSSTAHSSARVSSSSSGHGAKTRSGAKDADGSDDETVPNN
jgi:hypothetical protein